MRNLLLLPLLTALLNACPVAAQPIAQPGPAPLSNTAKNWVVSGQITDEANRPFPGVIVLVKGTTLSTQTDSKGNYSLMVPNAAKAVLRFAFVGYITVEKPVKKMHTLNLRLQTDNRQLNEVVVTAYGIETKKAVTGAASQVLQGKAEGVQIQTAAPAAKARRAKSLGYSTDDYAAPSSGLMAPPLPARAEAGAGDTYAHVQETSFLKPGKNRSAPFRSTWTMPPTATCAVSSTKASCPRATPCGWRKC